MSPLGIAVLVVGVLLLLAAVVALMRTTPKEPLGRQEPSPGGDDRGLMDTYTGGGSS